MLYNLIKVFISTFLLVSGSEIIPTSIEARGGGRGSSIISSNIYEKNMCHDSKIFVEVLICVTIMSLSSISGNNYDDPLVYFVGEGGGGGDYCMYVVLYIKLDGPQNVNSLYTKTVRRRRREKYLLCVSSSYETTTCSHILVDIHINAIYLCYTVDSFISTL